MILIVQEHGTQLNVFSNGTCGCYSRCAVLLSSPNLLMSTTMRNSLSVTTMQSREFVLVLLAMQIVISRQWPASEERKSVKVRKSTSDNTKYYPPGSENKRWVSREPGYRELRKKPSGHLTPLRPDDMDTDGVVSVAVGPPPIRPKFDRSKAIRNQNNNNNTLNKRAPNNNAVNFVKDILTQLGREFLTHQVNEDFVFGQYIGNSMKNLTSALKLRMQHEILDIIVKYQRINNGDIAKEDIKPKEEDKNKGPKYDKTEKKTTNETEEPWPDFSNLAKIVG
ncbi:uncharacterized protein LOC133521829 [Cydia pomonella]|uniref:uncharacterized protein LOC133521829 n=1 Tax=Cydia pomonella TaxID=82600 RepID=UPI002ADD3D34|nr:uncharacterized protein LOC133521829 [Cydia pomonella]